MFRFKIVLLFCLSLTPALIVAGSPLLPNGTGAPDAVVLNDSWRLWLDEAAEWKHDRLCLPDEVDLATLPVNSPTAGWRALNDQAGIPVTLPGTVEEHYWGRPPLPTANAAKPQDVV